MKMRMVGKENLRAEFKCTLLAKDENLLKNDPEVELREFAIKEYTCKTSERHPRSSSMSSTTAMTDIKKNSRYWIASGDIYFLVS